jgi:flavin reductase (DIM6/NTAB) family NADH-FMN oxidoreductase RutF
VTGAAHDVPGPPGVDPERFRDAVGRFPTGVTVVTARVGNRHHGMTANSFTSVSLDPVLVLVCVERTARLHEMILAAGGWGVSVLAEDQEEVSRLFAAPGRPPGETLRAVPHHYGELTGAALLDGALATLECQTVAIHDGGDHTVLLGEVLGVRVSRPDGGPLVYHRGEYRRLE